MPILSLTYGKHVKGRLLLEINLGGKSAYILTKAIKLWNNQIISPHFLIFCVGVQSQSVEISNAEPDVC